MVARIRTKGMARIVRTDSLIMRHHANGRPVRSHGDVLRAAIRADHVLGRVRHGIAFTEPTSDGTDRHHRVVAASIAPAIQSMLAIGEGGGLHISVVCNKPEAATSSMRRC